jgi:hypothetical protein
MLDEWEFGSKCHGLFGYTLLDRLRKIMKNEAIILIITLIGDIGSTAVTLTCSVNTLENKTKYTKVILDVM